ncbi:murinoglobulin-1 isoform X2 [Cherax quadricarinatus]|uniref:murinoglobulin-1 isoform X2 n=1 Tax=Cherax quadricarinatus TaxID=27406 RepID=UPI00387E2C51
MAAPGAILCAVVVALAQVTCSGNYVITTPREWVKGRPTQVCVLVSDAAAPAGTLQLAVNTTFHHYKKEDETIVLIPAVTIPVPAGAVDFCERVDVPEGVRNFYDADLYVTGRVAGVKVNHTAQLTIDTSSSKTIIQTDKYLYQPGQKVQIRILSFDNPNFNVSTQPYQLVWVRTPSQTRVAQWTNVDNSAGLVHLTMTLVDEPEQGTYKVFVKTADNRTSNAEFKVEEYVLPRFEVVVTPPRYIFPTDTKFSFRVCAKYTFGEPVRGNLTLEVSNAQSRNCRVAVNKTDSISGCREVEVHSEEIRMIDCSVNTVQVKAIVSEEGTGVLLTDTSHVTVSRRALTFHTVYEDDYMKPNLPYTLKVKAELPDKTPAVGAAIEMCAAERCSNLTVPQNGIITAILFSPTAKRFTMKAGSLRAVMESTTFTNTIEHYYSPSNSSLLIHAPEGRLKCNPGVSYEHRLPVLFSSAGQTKVAITVQIVARKEIKYSSTKEYELVGSELPINEEHVLDSRPPLPLHTTTGVIHIPLSLPLTASPHARVLIWYTRDDGEVVADTKNLEVDKCLLNAVNISWSEQKAQPKQKAVLKLTSAPKSICSLGVVDKSVELLNQQSDPFSIEALFSHIQYYQISIWSRAQVDDYNYCRNQLGSREETSAEYYTNYVDALKMFDKSGLFIFSNLKVETRPCEKSVINRVHYGSGGVSSFSQNRFGGEVMKFAAPQYDSLDESSPAGTTGDSPRTYFPETWLWDLFVLPSDGISSKEVTMPDTITQWVGKAVCVHPQEGLGVSQKSNITAFTSFFVDLTLPPSIKRGETLPVKISIFNYLEDPLPISVTLLNSFKYEILTSDTEAPGHHTTCVNAQSKIVHTVKIKPSVIGSVNITVAAKVDHQSTQTCGPRDSTVSKSDTLIRAIDVEAEGFPRENAWTKYVCARDIKAGTDSLESWEVVAPPAIVEGSERGWITAVGDLLSLSLENLDSLIRMPSGCGEQNMLKFAPNIFILQYLKATKQDNPEVTKKLADYMNTGYQRQLLYRRNDGSFSAFGKADDSGSTWLTAFVLKSFAQAKSFILIDEESLTKTQSWLLGSQNSTGCFYSIGKVFNKGMKGGIDGQSSPVPLTAYVMIALLEAGLDPNVEAVSSATTCVTDDLSQDPYTLALRAYALALAQHPKTQEVLQQLTDEAKETKNDMHWEIWSGNTKNAALSVETAGYAVLAMMASDSRLYEQKARKVIKWISTQRNGRGGFYSTQDTVVALQALSSYETRFYEGDLNMVATVNASGFDYSFTVDESNKFLTQLMPLPDLPTRISLNIVGQGCVMVQSVIRYNVPEPEASDAFKLTVNTHTEPDKNCITKRIKACATYLLPDGKSNMAVMEVKLVSGYVPEKLDLKQITRDVTAIKKYEVDGSKVAFYIDELTPTEVCASFRILREVDVEHTKPGTIVLYDYYQPEFSVDETYRLPLPTDCIYAW